MKVLVTGARGQVARALLSAAPANVNCIGISHDELDITSSTSEAQITEFAPDYIINAAAYTDVDGAEGQPAAAEAVNCHAVSRLANLGIPLTHISTDYVFNGRLGRPSRPSDATDPINVYGVTKRAGEKAALDAGALVIRSAWIYAADGRNFVTAMLARMEAGEDLRIVCDQIGTPTHAQSLARAIWTLIGAEQTGLHHYTDAGAASWYDFAIAIAEEATAVGASNRAVSVFPIRSENYPTPAMRPRVSLLDCHETWAITGQPNHWRAELREMLKGLIA